MNNNRIIKSGQEKYEHFNFRKNEGAETIPSDQGEIIN
jgi:hypothetical protein